ncbi:MAG TPA: MarR family transcriptional regulator [Chloroflexota bacterium]|nr:MarR family transcriptional regulator [Chloroflexota bacterium]
MKHEELLAAIQRAQRALSSQTVLFSQAMAERLGLTPSDLECLGFLLEEGAATAGRLAEITGLTSGAITGVVDRLERAGYVNREPDPSDRRRVVIRPNPGRAERDLAPLFRPMTGAMNDLCARFTDEQLAVILDFTTRAVPITQTQAGALRQGDGAAPPLGPATSGRLVFASGLSRLQIRGGAPATDLYQARFDGTLPKVEVQDGTVRFRDRSFWLKRRGTSGEIALNPTIPWRIECKGGAWKVNADLKDLRVQGISLTGGASDISVTLPRPVGTVPVRVVGGANKVTLVRPAGTAARLRMNGSFHQLSFDGENCDVLGGDEIDLTHDYGTPTDRYDILIEGGANRVVVDVERG